MIKFYEYQWMLDICRLGECSFRNNDVELLNNAYILFI